MVFGDLVTLQNVLLAILAAVFVLYLYYHQKYDYWKSKGISYVKPYFVFGNMLDILGQPMHLMECQRYTKYGRLYGTYEGVRPVLHVAEPDLLKLIMVKDFHVFTDRRHLTFGNEVMDSLLTILRGDEWKRVRSIISPSFTSGRMRKMAYLINESANSLVENLLKSAETKSPVDCKKYFGSFTMDTIARCAFGTKINAQTDDKDPFIMHARKMLNRDSAVFVILMMTFPWLPKLFGSMLGNMFESVMGFFSSISKQIMQKRKESGERGNDFLQLVMDAREGKLQADEDKEDDSHYDIGTNRKTVQFQSIRNKGLSENEVLAQCLLFFLVGYDTTATTLSLAAYCLALNQECQDKLIKEIDDVWERNVGKIDFDTVTKMPYLDGVVSETLRLHTVLPALERVALEDYVLGDTGFTIPKGMLISIPVFPMHNDPEWYPEPDKFDPERFTMENKASRDPFTFLPFGGGPRNCIGMRFALMEAKMCLVHALRHVRFFRSPETKVPLEYYKGQGLIQPKNVILQVQKRIH